MAFGFKRYHSDWLTESVYRYWPGFRTVFNDRWLVPPFRVKWLTPGLQWPFYTNYDDFEKAGWDVITAVRSLCSCL